MLEGDEWKHAKEPADLRTRAELQHASNMDYAFGRITQEQWSARFDELSEPGADVIAAAK